jgi:RNA polymerase sigma factor (sigma-70 family)
MLFEELIKRVSLKLKGITRKISRHYWFLSDEDLFQEALIHLWQHFNAGKLGDKTDSYILQGCYFYLKNYIRKTKDKICLMSMYSSINEEDSGPEDIFSFKDPRSFIDEVNNRVLIEEILNDGLTNREKQVFSLSLEGHTVREIGRMLGISHVSVLKSNRKIKGKCQKFKDLPRQRTSFSNGV